MRYLSLFSGIEAATVAWHPLGWECVGVAEIEPLPCSLLAHYYPNVPNLGDVTKITEAQIAALGRIDLVVFGSPCQDLSVAGKRKGFTNADGDSTRSGLFIDAMRIVRWARKHCGARFALWENVMGAFSSNSGSDFGIVVAEMAGLPDAPRPPKGRKWGNEGCAVGPDGLVEWSSLDAQWFGVAQRRRRVFALADFGNWANRPPILLEPDSLRGDTAPRRETGQVAAGTLAPRTEGGGFPGTDEACSGYVQPVAATLDASYGRLQGCSGQDATHGHSQMAVAYGGNNQAGPIDVATARNACASGSGRLDFESETFLVQSVALRGREGGGTAELGDTVAGTKRASGGGGDKAHVLASVCVTGDVTHTLRAEGFDASEDGTGRGQPIIAFHAEAQPDEMRFDPHVSASLTCSQHAAVYRRMAVRRLVPAECETLQGFPRNYTLVPHRGKPAKDGPRYKALGNSKAVPVVRWIGRRIVAALAHDIC